MPDSYVPGGSDFSGPINQNQGGINWGNVGGGALSGAAAGSFGGPIGAGIGAGVGAIASIFSSKKQSDAANASTDAATKAAAQQAAAAAQTLQFQRQQAEAQYTAQNATNKANYGQYAAKAERLNSVADILGLPHTNVPAFEPSPDPGFTNPQNFPVIPPAIPPSNPGTFGLRSNPANPSGPTPGQTTQAQSQQTAAQNQAAINNLPGAAGGAGVSADRGDIAAQVAQYFHDRGVTPLPTSVAKWQEYWNVWGKNDPAYFNTRLAQADEFGGGGAAPPANSGAAATSKPASVAQYLAQSPSPYTAPATPIPFVRPASVDQYLQR